MRCACNNRAPAWGVGGLIIGASEKLAEIYIEVETARATEEEAEKEAQRLQRKEEAKRKEVEDVRLQQAEVDRIERELARTESKRKRRPRKKKKSKRKKHKSHITSDQLDPPDTIRDNLRDGFSPPRIQDLLTYESYITPSSR